MDAIGIAIIVKVVIQTERICGDEECTIYHCKAYTLPDHVRSGRLKQPRHPSMQREAREAPHTNAASYK